MKFINLLLSLVSIIINCYFASGPTDSKSTEIAITKISQTPEKKDKLELTKYTLDYLKKFRLVRNDTDKME